MKTGAIVKRASLGVALAAACSFAAACLLGMLIINEILPLSSSGIAAGAAVFLSVLLTCYFTVRRIPQSKLPVALAMAVAYIVVSLFFGGVLFPASELQITWTIFLPVFAALIAGIWGSTQKKRRRYIK